MEVTRKILAVGNSAGTQGKGSLLNSTDGSTSVLLKVTGKEKGTYHQRHQTGGQSTSVGQLLLFLTLFIHSANI